MEVQLIGLAAGFLTTIAFFPQIIKSYKTKSTKDISWGWLSVLFFGIVLWLAYGLSVGDLPLIATNTVSILCVIALILLKKKYG